MTFRSALMGATALVAMAVPALAERGADGQVNILYWQAPSILNPYLSSGTKDVESSSMILEPLAGFDQNGELYPRLVQEIPTIENGGFSADLTTITWKLQEGLLWSDGTPVTAADVIFSWEYCTHPEGGCAQAARYEGVQSVEAIDDLTVKVTFTGPKPNPYQAFVGSTSPVLQKAQFANCLGAAAPYLHRRQLPSHRHRPVRRDRVPPQRRHHHGGEPQLPRPRQAALRNRELQGWW
jgi:peptide/nickel transport system substrate-binding protein